MNGWPSFSGRVLAAVRMTSMSSSLIRRGRPPPLRVQRGQALLIEGMDHVPDGVLIGGHQPGDRRDQRADADAMMIIARRIRTDPCLPRRTICGSRQAFLITQPPRPHRLSHRTLPPLHLPYQIECGRITAACQHPVNVCGQRTSRPIADA